MSAGGTRRRVALTFDMEHPSRGDNSERSPEQLLAVLARHGCRATFFIQGRWARSHPGLARRVRDDGHLVGSHSHFHAPLPLLTDDGIRADLEKARDALLEVTGTDPRPWFRCPFGAGHDDARVLAVLGEAGYQDVHWDVDGEDWPEGRSPDDVARSVVDGVRSTSGDTIVLLHTWPSATPGATDRLIGRLSTSDCELVTVDDLVGTSTRSG